MQQNRQLFWRNRVFARKNREFSFTNELEARVINVPKLNREIVYSHPMSASDVSHRNQHVCFAPKSGHWRCTNQCLLRAKGGHSVDVVAKIENRHEAVFTSPDNAGYLFKSEFRRGLVNPLPVRGPIPQEECI